MSSKGSSKVAPGSKLFPTDPVSATAGAVSSWFSLTHPSTVVTGTGYSSVHDILNPSSPMTQSTDAIRPPRGTSANGLPIIATVADVLDVPLIAARVNTTRWGFWGWIRRQASANNFHSTGASSGSSQNRFYMEIGGGNTMVCRVFESGGAQRTATATIGALGTWQFFTVEYNASASGDARLVQTLAGSVVTTTFGGAAAEIPSSLVSVTGSGSFLAFTLAAAFPFIGSVGPNFGFLNAAMTGATEGLLTQQARLALMNYQRPT